jgi:hypothetical protein
VVRGRLVRLPLLCGLVSWLNGTLYHDLHTTNDLSVRVFTFGQMLAVAVMAVFIGDIPGRARPGSRSPTRRTP